MPTPLRLKNSRWRPTWFRPQPFRRGSTYPASSVADGPFFIYGNARATAAAPEPSFVIWRLGWMHLKTDSTPSAAGSSSSRQQHSIDRQLHAVAEVEDVVLRRIVRAARVQHRRVVRAARVQHSAPTQHAPSKLAPQRRPKSTTRHDIGRANEWQWNMWHGSNLASTTCGLRGTSRFLRQRWVACWTGE